MIPPPSLADGIRPLALSPTSPHNGMNGEGMEKTDSPIMGVQGNHSPAGFRAEPWPPEASSSASARPRGLNEALFNTVASFMGLPGLAPQRGADGSLDEGLGFHQDGTVRRAGSENEFDGERARAYQRAGLGTGTAGLNGLAPYYPDRRTAALWRDDDFSGRRDARNGSRSLDSLNPFDLAVERGLSYGMGLLNSAGEAALSGLTDDGRARLNFRMNKDGRLSGEGDVLLPLYDGRYTTLFTQLGARGMDVNGGEDDGSQRWIGNFGLGQRWFPLAEDLDNAGNLMLGYNVFFDNDFTRSHQRGGAGVEAQYDWFHVAANYYTPLSGWKASRDFDGDFVEERPARGWDARLKAYLPFYRNVALTGAYSQWYGNHVAMYGSGDDLEKDPRVWSYGVEYTPVPLVSGFVKQRSTERGKTDTEFGLQFTWHFGMPWEEQVSHAKVAELRSVSGSRHEFVDRENRIILEYRAKNAYRIEYLGRTGVNAFKFRLTDGLGQTASGNTASVCLAGATFAGSLAASSFTSDGSGEFAIQLDTVTATPVTAIIQAGSNTQSFTLTEAVTTGGRLIAKGVTGAGSGTSFASSQTAEITVELQQNGMAVSNPTITWSLDGSTNSSPAVVTARKAANTYYGLAWGGSASASPGSQLSGNAPTTGVTVQLTDIMGERTVTVKALATVDGTPYSVSQTVTFGNGPLSKMRLPGSSPGEVPTSTGWDNAVNLCGGTAVNADLIASAGYINASNLPEVNDLQAALGGGNSAYLAAGWTSGIGYWSGNASSVAPGRARYASSSSGSGDRDATNTGTAFVCRRN